MLAPSSDPFWNVAQREKAEIDAIQQEIRQLQDAVAVHNRAAALRHAVGFQEFIKQLQGLHETARATYENDRRLTNDGLREQRGYVRALKDVLALLTREGESSRLASELEQRHAVLADALKRRPKPRQPEEQT